MKKIIQLLTITAIVSLFIIGCTTSQQRTAYNTISTVQATADAAYDGYCTAVIKGVARTNEVPEISRQYNQFHMACLAAATTAQAGTNALAPASLTVELGNFTSLITSLTTK